jgi:hypothetical protein
MLFNLLSLYNILISSSRQLPVKQGDRIKETVIRRQGVNNPEIYGFKWADADGPRFQMEPQGYRGYIEGKPVREITA